MPKTVTASEAKNRLGSLMQWAVKNRDEVVIESRGEPTVVIMPYREYETVTDLREKDRRARVLAQLEGLRKRVQARNEDLSENDADDLADRFAREAVEDLVAEGKVRFSGS